MNENLDIMFREFWNSKTKIQEIQKIFKFSSENAVRKHAYKLNLYGKRDPRNPYNIQINSEIKKRYETGDSIAIIAKDLKLDRNKIHQSLIKQNISTKRQKGRSVLKRASKDLKSPYTNEEIIDYIKINYPKLTINKIALDMKCDRSTIKSRINALNL